jgi:hypothetical protein
MKNILNFEQFVNESLAEFGFSGFGYAMGSSTPLDPSANANMDFEKTVKSNQAKRLQDILMNVFSATQHAGKGDFEFEVEELKIVRIFPNNNGFLDIYIKFIMDEFQYYGVFKNWGNINGAKFESPVLNHPTIKHHLENAVKVEGIFKQILNEWFRPELGVYKTLKQVKVYNEMGEIFMLPENGEISVDEVLTEEERPIIYITFSDRNYFLTDLDYFFFHWWFQPREKTKFYI